jgi:hypothetical protein
MRRPTHDEAAEYYFKYIDQVKGDDVVAEMERQAEEAAAFLTGISEERSRLRYAEGKWSLREMLSHVNDGERLFTFRAFWFARGFDSPLPSFEQEIAVAHAAAEERRFADHVAEFQHVRAASLDFFRALPGEAWSRTGVASGYPFTVRSLAFILVGHVTHHLSVARERYLREG